MTQVSSPTEATAEVPLDRPIPKRRRSLLRTARPKQWVKNVLVVAAPGAAGILIDGQVLVRTGIAFVAFCLAASGTYFLNDATDADADRLHPRKRFRPVAAGHVSVRLARSMAVALMISSIAVAALATPELAVIVVIYLAMTISYSLWLKSVPVVDLAAVASGFVLRAIAGGAAAEVPLSQWFLMVASFGSLFIVAGKRHGETMDLGEGSAGHRATLGAYSTSFLQFVRGVAAAVALASYCLWAFEKAEFAARPIWFELSIIPFVLAILAYALRVERGDGSAPEDIVLHDRTILWMGAIWVMLFGLGVYGA